MSVQLYEITGVAGIFFVCRPLKGKLGDESEVHRKMPRLGSVQVRQNTPASVFDAGTIRPDGRQ